MTKYDLEAIQKWFNKHDLYWFCAFWATCALALSLGLASDAWWDGGSCVNGMDWGADPNVCHPGGKSIDWVMLAFSGVLFMGAIVTYLSLPVNTFMLWARGLTFHGDKKRELKLKAREEAIRAREKELELEPYELGSVSRQS
jgi:hypothetical protein